MQSNNNHNIYHTNYLNWYLCFRALNLFSCCYRCYHRVGFVHSTATQMWNRNNEARTIVTLLFVFKNPLVGKCDITYCTSCFLSDANFFYYSSISSTFLPYWCVACFKVEEAWGRKQQLYFTFKLRFDLSTISFYIKEKAKGWDTWLKRHP